MGGRTGLFCARRRAVPPGNGAGTGRGRTRGAARGARHGGLALGRGLGRVCNAVHERQQRLAGARPLPKGVLLWGLVLVAHTRQHGERVLP